MALWYNEIYPAKKVRFPRNTILAIVINCIQYWEACNQKFNIFFRFSSQMYDISQLQLLSKISAFTSNASPNSWALYPIRQLLLGGHVESGIFTRSTSHHFRSQSGQHAFKTDLHADHNENLTASASKASFPSSASPTLQDNDQIKIGTLFKLLVSIADPGLDPIAERFDPRGRRDFWSRGQNFTAEAGQPWSANEFQPKAIK